jgi:integrase
MVIKVNKIKPLENPKSRGDFGLKVDCSFCDTLVSGCRLNGKALAFCAHPECLSYKVIGYKKTGKRRTKNLQTRIYKEARVEAALFQNELKNNKKPEPSIQTPEIIAPPKVNIQTAPTPLLINEMASYMAYLRGADTVPEHKRRARSEAHCKSVENHLFDFIKSIKDDYKVKEITITGVTEDMVGKYFKSISSGTISPRSFNKSVGILQTFFNHLKKNGKINANPFSGIIRKPETHKISVLTKEEYDALVDVLHKPELGKRKVGTETKDYYREWILPAVKIGVMSGRRAEEILRSKFSDIERDENGEMLTLSVIDYKVSRQQNRLNDNPKRITVPLTEEIKKVLIDELNYEKLKDSQDYIIGNNEMMDRNTMKVFLGRSFTHYWEKTEYSKTKKASYKILRKTFLSSLASSIGISSARVVSQHSDTKVMEEHYISRQVLGITAKNFSVFSQTQERQAELHKLRKIDNKEISIEK